MKLGLATVNGESFTGLIAHDFCSCLEKHERFSNESFKHKCI